MKKKTIRQETPWSGGRRQEAPRRVATSLLPIGDGKLAREPLASSSRATASLHRSTSRVGVSILLKRGCVGIPLPLYNARPATTGRPRPPPRALQHRYGAASLSPCRPDARTSQCACPLPTHSTSLDLPLESWPANSTWPAAPRRGQRPAALWRG